MKNIYTNPRTYAAFPDWPYGRKTRTLCTFTVEIVGAFAGRRERISKVTVNPRTGRENKAKKTTFAPQVRIVDGSDGKTYILQKSNYSMVLYIKKSDFFDFESIHPEDERYDSVRKLFTEGARVWSDGEVLGADEKRERELEIDHNERQE